MRKYHTRAYFCEELGEEINTIHHAYTVYDAGSVTKDTGLLNKDGEKILVTESMDPIGFVLHKE